VDPVTIIEREKIKAAIEAARDIEHEEPDPNLGHFYATADKLTLTKNSVVLTMTVPWNDRNELNRFFDELPMHVVVTVERAIEI